MDDFDLNFDSKASAKSRDSFDLSFYALSDEAIFRASFEDASGRDPLPTALLERNDARKLCGHNVICYLYPPMLSRKIIKVPVGSFHLVTPGNMIWIKDPLDPLFQMGRWAQIQERRPLGIDSEFVDVRVRVSDHPESFLEPV